MQLPTWQHLDLSKGISHLDQLFSLCFQYGVFMNSEHVLPVQSALVEVECGDRWQVYHRLQELEIPCQCRAHKALKVYINSPAEAFLLWSVVRHVSLPRQVQIESLERCWQL